MARPRRTDTDDLVWPVCNELLAAGEEPQTRRVRAVLQERHGAAPGPNQVQESLDKWRETEKPRAGAPAEPLPAELTRGLTDWVARERLTARAEAEEQLAVVRVEKTDLLAALERRDREVETLTAQLAELTAERERLQGQVAQQAADLERLQRQFEAERRAAEEARVAHAQANLKAESEAAVAKELRAEREDQRRAIQAERNGRVEAERALAASDAGLKALREHFDQLRELHDELDAETKALQQQLDTERTARATAERERATARAEAEAAKAKAEDLAGRESQLRKDAERREALIEQLRTPVARAVDTPART